MNKKYILAVKNLHLGYIKESFAKGTIIEHDEENNCIIVDGRTFKDTRDLDILKKQSKGNKKDPWIVDYSEETLNKISSSNNDTIKPVRKSRISNHMKVIRSDSDLIDPVDIKDTQVSKRVAANKAAAKKKVLEEGMPIINADETADERLAKLKGKNDIKSIAERVELKQKKVVMPIVVDDSLGNLADSTATPLNSGHPSFYKKAAKGVAKKSKKIAKERKTAAEKKRLQNNEEK